ncbi:hypothetical protein BC829DRAFT_423245 [Chytridium lagenaria]|nr:hypothetical protein BC829DRAFT_423245 [Chytridium lagenaria]
MAVQTNTAMFWFRFLQTGYGRRVTASPPDPAVFWFWYLQTVYGRPAQPGRALVGFLQTGYGRPSQPGRIMVPAFTDRLRPARPPRPYFGWFLQTGYGRPARPGRALVRFLSHPAVLWYRFLQTGYGRPAPAVFRYRFLRPYFGIGFTARLRPARPTRSCFSTVSSQPGRVMVPVSTERLRPARPTRPYFGNCSCRPGYGRPARPGRISVIVLADRLRPARPTRPFFGTGSYRPDTAVLRPCPLDPAVLGLKPVLW